MLGITVTNCGFYNTEQSPFAGQKRSKPRTVTTFELELFAGDTGVSVLNTAHVPIRQGRVLFAKPGDVRYSYLPFKTLYLHFCVTDPALKAQLCQRPSFFEVADFAATESAFRRIISRWNAPTEWDRTAAVAALIHLLYGLDADSSQIGERGRRPAEEARRFAEQAYREPITVRDMAAHCNLSESYLFKLFRQTYGIAPNEFLVQVRLNAAKQLLQDTDLSVGTVALSCGFHSQSYFADCFRRREGVSPREFRRRTAYRL